MNGANLSKPVGDPNVIAVLEQALAMAKAGTIIGVGLAVVHGPGKPAVQLAGVGVVEMNTGADLLKQKLMELMLRPSPILRAG